MKNSSRIPLLPAPLTKLQHEKLKNNKDKMQQNWISTRNFVRGADSIEILVKLFKNYKAIWFLLSKVLFLGQKSLVSYQHLDFCTKPGANIFCQLSKKKPSKYVRKLNCLMVMQMDDNFNFGNLLTKYRQPLVIPLSVSRGYVKKLYMWSCPLGENDHVLRATHTHSQKKKSLIPRQFDEKTCGARGTVSKYAIFF